MLMVYTSPSCSSCRKVKSWLKEQNIDFVEKNIFNSVLNENELKDILSKTENGTEDIISKRSKIVKEQDVDIDGMTLKELIGFIKENPSILKRPIIVNERLVQVGYNEEEIRVFVPREARKIVETTCSQLCEEYEHCGKIREEKRNEPEQN